MKQKIKDLFKISGMEISDKQAGELARYYKLINENNSDNDLTRIKGEENFIIKHFIDSVYYTKYTDIPETLIDIGTGAGFPGIPLKIMFPHIKITLAEQRSRRVEFLKMAVKKLGLAGVDFYPHKVTEKSFFEVKGVITRALEDAPETLDRVEHFLPRGGRIILLKGPDAAGDIRNLTERNLLNYDILVDREYNLPGTDNQRRLLVFEKKTSAFRKIYKIMKDENETRGISVSSPENKTFREIKKLVTGEGIRKTGFITISGKKIIKDYLADADTDKCRLVLPDDYTENDNEFDELISVFNEAGNLFVFKKSLFNEIDFSGNRAPLLVTDMPVIDEWDGEITRGCNPVIPFQDPANVGAAVRSAAGFGVKRIILARGAANPYHPKSIRASAGAVFKMEFFKGPSVKDLYSMTGNRIPLVSLDRDGESIGEFSFPADFLLVPGSEGQGLPDELRKNSVSIPVTDSIESLNATVAFSLFVYEWARSKK